MYFQLFASTHWLRPTVFVLSAMSCFVVHKAVADTAEYQLPSAKIVKVLEAPPLPEASSSQDGKWILLHHRSAMVELKDIAKPIVTLARSRVDLKTNGSYGSVPVTGTGFTLIRVSDRQGWLLNTPGEGLGRPLWAPDSRNFLFLHTVENGIELWVVDVEAREAHALTGPEINAARHPLDLPCAWMPDSRRVLCLLIPKGRGAPPKNTAVPGPLVQESGFASAPISVKGGLLKDAHDEELYDYYMTAQPTLLDIESGAREFVGPAGVYDSLQPSPDGNSILSIRIVRPYSYHLEDERFPKIVEILNLPLDSTRLIAKLPMDESGSFLAGYTFNGPRRFSWVLDLAKEWNPCL